MQVMWYTSTVDWTNVFHCSLTVRMPFTSAASESLEQWWAIAMKDIAVTPARGCAMLLRTISLKPIILGDYCFLFEGFASNFFFSGVAKGFILEAFVIASKFVW